MSHASASTLVSRQPAAAPSAERVTCGWCNRFLSGDPRGAIRHVTCDDCRALAAAMRPAVD